MKTSKAHCRAVFPASAEVELVQAFFGGRCDGTFVEVGANDPFNRSATHHLEVLGWSGALVEPLPDCAAALRDGRTGTVFEAACVAPEQAGETATLHVAGAHSSLDHRLAEPRSRTGTFIEVSVITLDEVIEQAALDRVDLLAVDTEGTEIDVLEGIDLARHAPKLILLEDHVHDWSKCRYMRSRGYTLIRRTGYNSWYVPRARGIAVGGFGRLQLFNRYVLKMPLKRFRRWRHLREVDRS